MVDIRRRYPRDILEYTESCGVEDATPILRDNRWYLSLKMPGDRTTKVFLLRKARRGEKENERQQNDSMLI